MRIGLVAAIFLVSISPEIAKSDTVPETIKAQTYEHERVKGGRIHGKITINGKTFDFVSGGRGRGSAPFGLYRVGSLGGFSVKRTRTVKKGKKGKSITVSSFIPGFPLSDAYDPLVKDRRDGLYLHPGHNASAGCFAIRADEWPTFVQAMQTMIKAGFQIAIDLEPGENLPKDNLVLASTGKHVKHKVGAKRTAKASKHHKAACSKTHSHHRKKHC